MFTDKRIGVLMGGTSAEREVSLRSGNAIYKALQGSGYNVVAIDAGPDICNVLNREKVELAFLALHGGCGENGSIQGMLEVLGIKYTGSGSTCVRTRHGQGGIEKDIPLPRYPGAAFCDSEKRAGSREHKI